MVNPLLAAPSQRGAASFSLNAWEAAVKKASKAALAPLPKNSARSSSGRVKVTMK